MGFAAMAGRRTKLRLYAGISSSSGVTNNIRLYILSSTTKQNRAAVRGWTSNEYRHSSKPCPLGETFNEQSVSEMKKIIIIILLTSTFSKAFCQKDSLQIKLINDKILSIESALVIQPKACVDSSKIALEPFKELYYKNRLTGQLGKVDKIISSPEVKLTYYFSENSLIKVIVIDKSTNYTLNIESYFVRDKLVYSTHRSIDGDNSGKMLIKSAKEYIERYSLIMKYD